MKIERIISQNDIEIQAVFECEHCKNEFIGAGLDTEEFYNVVLPNLLCPGCKLNRFGEDEMAVNKKLSETLTLELDNLFAYVEEHLRPKCCDCDRAGVMRGRDGNIRCGPHHGDYVLKINSDWG